MEKFRYILAQDTSYADGSYSIIDTTEQQNTLWCANISSCVELAIKNSYAHNNKATSILTAREFWQNVSIDFVYIPTNNLNEFQENFPEYFI